MIPYLGDFVEDDVVYLMFNTFTSDDPSASSTITNFINTDVHIHKDDGLTQRNNAAGITVSVNFDGITGSHMIKIDTNDNTVAGFWVTGADYFVRIEGTTVDAATINAVVAHFSIQNRFMRGTDSANTTVPDAAGVAPTAAEIKTEVEQAGSSLAQILADTGELQTDWVNGGRLDLILDIIAADTTTDIPALIATAQADLDTITGADGVTLATAQALYAPNKVVPDAAGVAPTAAEIKTEIEQAGSSLAQILTDTGTTLPARFTGVEGATFDTATDSLEAIRDRGDAAWVTGAGGSPPTTLQNTTIATLASQTSFTLTAGSADDDAYNGCIIVVEDSVTATQKAVGRVLNYTGATKTITLEADPAVFTMAAGDTIDVVAVEKTWAAVTKALTDKAGFSLAADQGAVTIGTTTTNTDMRGTDSANTTVPDAAGVAPTAAEIKTEVEQAGSSLALILADSGELQTDWVNGGRLDLILDIIAADTTTDIPALIAALNDLSAANVNTEVADVLKTDTISEPAQGAPPATPTFEEVMAYLYFKLRNKTETTATGDAVYDDAGTTKLIKSVLSDNGTTFTKGEYISGV